MEYWQRRACALARARGEVRAGAAPDVEAPVRPAGVRTAASAGVGRAAPVAAAREPAVRVAGRERSWAPVSAGQPALAVPALPAERRSVWEAARAAARAPPAQASLRRLRPRAPQAQAAQRQARPPCLTAWA